MIRFLKNNFELLFWIAAIVALAATNPSAASQYTLCPLKLMGVTWCPGCGIGHSISWLLHGNLIKSWHAHWFGVPALLIISYRIFVLGRRALRPENVYTFDV
ncbi:DUF2752 domain-containing protein [Mucilaginibacter sp. dw_454]|uniref:DUF2752 domain-containing protein n=1 Tax=Mucilaginibacter sp. dw_454 TaxID=2720079 RepID=UPI001C4A5C43|nr:DUF2752 domain-containing protein [Mucilaginibacter sp. dw_454]